MIEKMIEWSVKNKFMVVLATLFVIAAGVTAMLHTPLDAIPDLSDVQVIVYTEYSGQGPQVVEDQVTYPLTAALLGIFALAGPTWEREPAAFGEERAPIVVLLKATPSMLAKDIQPTRLERAVLKLRDLLEERPGALTALIAYSGSAHLVMPLTRDARIIELFAAEISPDILPKEGDALAAAVNLDHRDVPGRQHVFGFSGLALGENRRMFDDPQLGGRRRIAGVGEFAHRPPGRLILLQSEVAHDENTACHPVRGASAPCRARSGRHRWHPAGRGFAPRCTRSPRCNDRCGSLACASDWCRGFRSVGRRSPKPPRESGHRRRPWP